MRESVEPKGSRRSSWASPLVLAGGLIVMLGGLIPAAFTARPFFADAVDRPVEGVSRDSALLAQGGAERVAPSESGDRTRSEDWPALFGAHGDSRSAALGLDWTWAGSAPSLNWERSLGRGYSAPVARGQRVFTFHRRDDEEVIGAVELETGRLLWEATWPTRFRCRYEYSDGPYSTPLVAHDRILAVGAEGRFVCLAIDDGRLLWSRDLREELGQPLGPYGFGAGLLEDAGQVFLNVGGVERRAGVAAFDVLTGATLWTATDQGAAFTTPRMIVHGENRRLLVLTDTGLVCLNPATGAEAWTFPFRSRVADTVNAVTPLVQGSRVLLVAGPGTGAACLELTDDAYEVVWRDRRVLDSVFNPLVPHEGMIFGFGARRQGGATLRRLDFATGRLQWQRATELDRGQAVAVDGRLLILGERGHLGVVSLDDPTGDSLRVTDEPILAAPCYSAPALHRGRLLLRNEQCLRCYDLR